MQMQYLTDSLSEWVSHQMLSTNPNPERNPDTILAYQSPESHPIPARIWRFLR